MRVFLVCIGFNNPEVIRGMFKGIEETVDTDDTIRKVFCEPGYPIPDKALNKSLNKSLCESFGWDNIEIENHGVIRNWNYIIHEILIPRYGMTNGDFLMTADPDVRFNKKGWVPAMVEALNSDPNAMFCASSRDFHEHAWMQEHPYLRKVTQLESGLRISRFNCLIAWASGIWRADFLITRPRNFAENSLGWYGWNEARDYDRLLENGKTWLAVTDFIDHHSAMVDQKYIDWKLESAQGKTHIGLEEWLHGHQ